jgi:acetylornithine deacetylase
MYWLDSADSQPCVGSGSVAAWRLEASGKLFHSGMTHHGINALELLHDAVAELQRRFYAHFVPLPQERDYGFAAPCTIKPTVAEATNNSANQVPGTAACKGDIRLTPWYDLSEAIQRVDGWIAEINAELAAGTFFNPERGPASRYRLPDACGALKLTWLMEQPYRGIACDRTSKGYKLLAAATEQVIGECRPFATTGSLPLVYDLQRRGFDLQLIGYGLESTYHGDNEYGLLSDFRNGMAILVHMICAN